MEANPSIQYWYISSFFSGCLLKQDGLFHWFVDILLILGHSFYLFHKKDPRPVLSAA